MQRGDDGTARYLIEQMHRTEQRVTLAQADLREHQRATQELIQNVNVLDAAVAEARRQQPDRFPIWATCCAKRAQRSPPWRRRQPPSVRLAHQRRAMIRRLTTRRLTTTWSSAVSVLADAR
jgi:hypothetical protein